MKVIGHAAAINHANHSVSKTAMSVRLRDALYADAENTSIITKAIVSIGRIKISTNGRTFRPAPTPINTRIRMRPSEAYTVEIASPPRRTSHSKLIQNGNSRTVAIAITINRSGDNDR